MSADVETGHWWRPLPQQVRARCETASWWLGLPAALWALVALLWATWAWIPAGALTVWFVLILATARAHVRAQRWSCTDDTFLAERGVVVRTSSALPWSRVREVELTEGPIDSRLGLASLVVKVPGLGLPVGGLAADHARALRAEILTRAGRPVTDPGSTARDLAAEHLPAGTTGEDAPAEAGIPASTGSSVDVPPAADAWFRAHPASAAATWMSTVLWLTAFAGYLVLRESEDVASVAGALERLASAGRVQVGAGVVVGLGILGTVWSEVVRRRTAWALDDGLLHERYTGRSRRHTTTPVERIERVDLTVGVGQRVLGLATVKVMTALGDDATTIGSLPRDRAENLRARLLVAAREGSVEKAPVAREQAHALEGAGAPVDVRDSEAPATADATAPGPDRPADATAGPAQLDVPPLAVTDRATVVRAFVVRDPLLPAALVGVVGTAVALVSGSSEMLFPCLAALAFAGRRAWRSFDSSLGRTVTSAPEGLVVTSGLGTLSTRTLRRGRTHAVRLSRRLAWWGTDLWAVTALCGASEAADESDESDDEMSGAVVTASGAATALAVAQAALPDLARVDRHLLRDVWPATDHVVVPDPAVDGAPVSVLRVPARAWWLHPWTWRCRVAAIVADGVLVRTGRLAPQVTFVPLRHVQGVALDEGPLLRRARVVGVDVHLVEGPVSVTAGPFEPAVARQLAEVLGRAASHAPGLDPKLLDGGRMGA